MTEQEVIKAVLKSGIAVQTRAKYRTESKLYNIPTSNAVEKVFGNFTNFRTAFFKVLEKSRTSFKNRSIEVDSVDEEIKFPDLSEDESLDSHRNNYGFTNKQVKEWKLAVAKKRKEIKECKAEREKREEQENLLSRDARRFIYI